MKDNVLQSALTTSNNIPFKYWVSDLRDDTGVYVMPDQLTQVVSYLLSQPIPLDADDLGILIVPVDENYR